MRDHLHPAEKSGIAAVCRRRPTATASFFASSTCETAGRTMTCKGNSKKVSGGSNALSVHQYKLLSLVTSTASTSSSSSSSVALSVSTPLTSTSEGCSSQLHFNCTSALHCVGTRPQRVTIDDHNDQVSNPFSLSHPFPLFLRVGSPAHVLFLFRWLL
ncbi:hypothetical protein DFJ73DRAFT_531562 [Zopfochytrium polystomum]|nr:hypothetical protein DFJ73DRAFT_531562 [Zopfochytrium polystomum]